MLTYLELGALGLPLLITAVMYLRYSRKIVVFELAAVVFGCFGTLVLLKALCADNTAADVRFETQRVQSAGHRDRHTTTGPGMKLTPNGQLKPGIVTTTHPEKNFVTVNGKEYSIENTEYQRLRDRWGNPQQIDTHNESVSWPGDAETAVYLMTTAFWQNRHQFSDRGREYPTVTEAEQQQFSLQQYPLNYRPLAGGHGLDISSTLGDGGTSRADADRRLFALNAKRAGSRGPQFWILLFPGQPKKAAELQEALWKGGNENEFVVCLGLGAEAGGPFQWVHCFTWSATEGIAEDAEKAIVDLDTADLSTVVGYLDEKLAARWMAPNDPGVAWYQVPLTTGSLISVYILAAAISVVFLLIAM